MQYVYFIACFYGGVMVGFFARNWVLQRYSRRHTGTIFVTDAEGMKTFTLELDEDPENIESAKEVVFKVSTPKNGNRD